MMQHQHLPMTLPLTCPSLTTLVSFWLIQISLTGCAWLQRRGRKSLPAAWEAAATSGEDMELEAKEDSAQGLTGALLTKERNWFIHRCAPACPAAGSQAVIQGTDSNSVCPQVCSCCSFCSWRSIRYADHDVACNMGEHRSTPARPAAAG